MNRFHQMGRFKVDPYFFAKLDVRDGINLFHNMIVFDVRMDLVTAQREYVAMHPGFRPVRTDEQIPEYNAVFTPGSSLPTWYEIPPLGSDPRFLKWLGEAP